jgi:lysophospholipase L1-like esterase
VEEPGRESDGYVIGSRQPPLRFPIRLQKHHFRPHLPIAVLMRAGRMPGMNRRPVLMLKAAIIALALAGCSTPQEPETRTGFVLARDGRFRYEGRFDFSNANLPVVIWQASRISVDFEGDTVSVLFDRAKGQSFFNAVVDNSIHVIEVREGSDPRGATISGLGAGRHHLVLFKRSEADAGIVRFRGVKLAPGAKVWAPPEAKTGLRVEFFGDSITVGACNEDGDTDQWDNRLTHNAASSYAALTAEAFSADYRNIAVSGMGIATGWVAVKAGEMWDRLYPSASSERADLRSWTPDVVFVNLGENDDSYPRAHNQPFPAGFTEGYVSLVRAIRAAYPKAHIVLLRGGMFGGAQSEPLRKAWEAAVVQLEGTDRAISHFVFRHWTRNHPRTADHRTMADELTGWLTQQHLTRTHSQDLRP